MANFMIQYIYRFKNRFEREISELGNHPLSQPTLHELQLTRARRVVNAANVIIAMGPNAMRIDHKKFENWRSILLGNNVSYNQTQRQIRNGTVSSTKVIHQSPLRQMRRR